MALQFWTGDVLVILMENAYTRMNEETINRVRESVIQINQSVLPEG